MPALRVRTLDEVARAGHARWFEPALELARRAGAIAGDAGWFHPGAPRFAARAPARLDVMGGIADYSGSLVLQLPLDRSTTVVAQGQHDRTIEVVSLRRGVPHRFRITLDALVAGSPTAPDALAAWFAARPDDHWASYVIGAVAACLARVPVVRRDEAGGMRLLVDTTVPEGKGISSSAALEVATFHAVAALLQLDVGGEEAALACQWAENRIAGAPCGIMDQMTASCGEAGRLLRLRCQPGTIEGHLAIPPGYAVHGIDSGIRHAVTGADYGTVRTAAFMGYRMIAALAGLPVTAGPEGIEVEDARWHGYLANVAPDEFTARFESRLPETMTGAAFLAEFGATTDAVTRVVPHREYPVRQATRHPVLEHARVLRFAELLADLPRQPAAASEMGHLMTASHASYGACGLGSDGTDRLVALAGEVGLAGGIFGAKITGGGSGGTVAVFARDSAAPGVHALAERYAADTGRDAEVFSGSSPGAAATGVLVLP